MIFRSHIRPVVYIRCFCNLQIVFAIWQVEQCPDTGRLHCQAYLRFTSCVAFTRVRKLFPQGDHVELCKGDESSNISYCSKDESRVLGPFSFGEPAKAGKRSDLDNVREMVKAGKGMADIVAVATSYQSMRSAELILKYTERMRDWVMHVRWYHGSTGSGKTQSALKEFKDQRIWVSDRDGVWFEGYDAHEVVIFDDIRGDFCKFHILLRLLDSTPFRIMNKGGSRQFLAKTVIITCPYTPQDLFSTQEDIDQLLRRINVIKLFGTPVSRPVPTASAAHFRGR